MIGRFFAKIFGVYPVVVQFENGKYGVRASRIMKAFYDKSGETWLGTRCINKFCMFNTLGEAQEVQKNYALKYKIIQA